MFDDLTDRDRLLIRETLQFRGEAEALDAEQLGNPEAAGAIRAAYRAIIQKVQPRGDGTSGARPEDDERARRLAVAAATPRAIPCLTLLIYEGESAESASWGREGRSLVARAAKELAESGATDLAIGLANHFEIKTFEVPGEAPEAEGASGKPDPFAPQHYGGRSYPASAYLRDLAGRLDAEATIARHDQRHVEMLRAAARVIRRGIGTPAGGPEPQDQAEPEDGKRDRRRPLERSDGVSLAFRRYLADRLSRIAAVLPVYRHDLTTAASVLLMGPDA